MSKTKINKSVFLTCQKLLNIELNQYGYIAHTAYKPGWEPTHQQYQCDWLMQNISSGIDEISMTLEPRKRLIRISRRVVHPPLGDKTSIHELSTDPSTFSDYWINYPFTWYTLQPSARRWWHFRKKDLRLFPQEFDHPDTINLVFSKHIYPFLAILVSAKKEDSKHPFLSIDHVNLTTIND